MTVADRIADKVVVQALRLSRFEAGTRKKVEKLLREIEADITAQLIRRNPALPRAPRFRERRLLALQAEIRQSLRAGYQGVAKAVNADLRGMAGLEALFTTSNINGLVGGALMTTTITPGLASSLVSEAMIRGAPSSDWWAGQAAANEKQFVQSMRLGMAQGEGVPDLVRRLRGNRAIAYTDGMAAKWRRDASALVRTSVQTVSNDVREATFRANSDVVKGMQLVATLDGKTTDICIALSGALWDLEGNPLPDSPSDVPRPAGPPFHWNCRSVVVAVLRSLEEIAGIAPRKAAMLERDLSPGMRASMDGQKAADITMHDFLKGKTNTFQDGVLGKTRAGLWRAGKLPLPKLIDQSARPLSLEGLRKSVRGVTTKAIEAARAGKPIPRKTPRKIAKKTTTPRPITPSDIPEAAPLFQSLEAAQAWAKKNGAYVVPQTPAASA